LRSLLRLGEGAGRERQLFFGDPVALFGKFFTPGGCLVSDSSCSAVFLTPGSRLVSGSSSLAVIPHAGELPPERQLFLGALGALGGQLVTPGGSLASDSSSSAVFRTPVSDSASLAVFRRPGSCRVSDSSSLAVSGSPSSPAARLQSARARRSAAN